MLGTGPGVLLAATQVGMRTQLLGVLDTAVDGLTLLERDADHFCHDVRAPT